MDPKGKAGDLERRVSTRTSVGLESDDNRDDEHDLALAGMVTDGFRPRHSNGTAEPSTPTLTSASSATLLPDESPGSVSSTSKPYPPQFALSVNHEPNVLTRQTTGSTESTGYIPADSPYQGPTGPTHPYQLYSQNVRSARTLSMATSSTLPMSESSYRGPRGPSHPYTNFPSEGIVSDAMQTAAIPLGFRGLPDQYQRRVGPDGEEIADMIGPDGHTEQLPPYTRYPDEAYVRKATAADGPPGVIHGAAAVVPPILTVPTSTVHSIPGAGGLGLATRNPEFESTDDLSSPRSRHSARSFTSDDSHRRIKLGDEDMAEKTEQPKKWQAWMRRKLCGTIPYWAICLAGLVLLVMAVVLGAVIGSMAANKQKRPPRKDGTWERQFDVIPIPTPTDLQPLPTGRYSLPLLANRVSNTCFEDPTLSKAWSCHIVISGMHLTVVEDGDDYRASLDSDHSLTLMNNVYAYGEQPPLVAKPVALDLVSDKFEPSRGPAWFKMLSYNKTVIVPSHLLDPNGSSTSQQNARRVASIAGRSNFKRKGVAQPGDKPWVCNWPGTYLELFIYAQQNSSFSTWGKSLSMSSASSTTASELTSTAPTPTPPPTPVDGSNPSTESSSPPSEGPQTDSTDDPDDKDDTEHNNDPDEPDDTDNHTPKYRFPQRVARWPEQPPTSSSTQPTPTTETTTTTTTTPTNPFGPTDTDAPNKNKNNYPPLPPPPYPRVMKLAERRISTRGAPPARCTQVEIQGPGEEARVLRDENGEAVVVEIEETEAFMGPPVGRGGPLVEDAGRKREVGGGGGGGPPDISPCGCMWFLT